MSAVRNTYDSFVRPIFISATYAFIHSHNVDLGTDINPIDSDKRF
jgi:hypothetical protein